MYVHIILIHTYRYYIDIICIYIYTHTYIYIHTHTHTRYIMSQQSAPRSLLMVSPLSAVERPRVQGPLSTSWDGWGVWAVSCILQ